MIDGCYNCRYADEYIPYYAYPYITPTCTRGEQMNKKTECTEYKQIGRLSR